MIKFAQHLVEEPVLLDVLSTTLDRHQMRLVVSDVLRCDGMDVHHAATKEPRCEDADNSSSKDVQCFGVGHLPYRAAICLRKLKFTYESVHDKKHDRDRYPIFV